VTGNVLTPDLGQDITCTFTNQDVLVPPTSPPPTTAPPTTVPPTSQGPLPVTGSSSAPLAGAGLAAVVLGAGLLLMTLRRRRRLVDY
jgi:LPXTG-motif cell wall-anchored protein